MNQEHIGFNISAAKEKEIVSEMKQARLESYKVPKDE